jgi:hypothetical protein
MSIVDTFKVFIMGNRRINIPKEILIRLYSEENLSMSEIGRKLNCNFQTISNRLREYRIPLKTPAQARMRYVKMDFDGSLTTKAYMVAFRIGDLNVVKQRGESETIIVRCHTTQDIQIDIMESLFSSFGHIKFSNSGKNLYANAYLNNSFRFLIKKDFASWAWVRNEVSQVGWSFIAGYVDAEGNFILNQDKGRFKIDSYDKLLLKWMSSWLEAQGVRTCFRRIAIKGSISCQGYIWNSDLWRLNINAASSLELFIDGIIPFLRHAKRIDDAVKCLQNVLERKLYGKVR